MVLAFVYLVLLNMRRQTLKNMEAYVAVLIFLVETFLFHVCLELSADKVNFTTVSVNDNLVIV